MAVAGRCWLEILKLSVGFMIVQYAAHSEHMSSPRAVQVCAVV